MAAVELNFPDELLEQIAQRAAAILAERQAPVTSPWLDADGAAEHLATNRERIYDLVALERLTPKRDGRRLLFRREDLDAYLENGNGGGAR